MLASATVTAITVVAHAALLDLIALYATLFISFPACLLLRIMRGSRNHDLTACLILGLIPPGLFAISFCGEFGFGMEAASLIPLLSATLRHRAVVPPSEDHPIVPARSSKSMADLTASAAAVTRNDDTSAVGNVYFADYVRWIGKVREMLFARCLPGFDLGNTPFLIFIRDVFCQFVGEPQSLDAKHVRHHPAGLRVLGLMVVLEENCRIRTTEV